MSFPSFGETLKAFRRHKGLTQQELAIKLGTHRNTIGIWERGEYLPDSRGIVLELARILRLDDQETRQLLEASLTALAPYWAVPYPRNPFFTGREEILEELHRCLGPDQAVALTQAHAISGLGGIGKTQIAVEYAYRHALEYSAVFWIAGESMERIISSFLSIAEILQLPERREADQQRIVAAVQRWLNTHSGWLLIWDNLEEMEILSSFLPPTRQGAFLVTTRQQAFGQLAQGIELSSMEPEEGIRFLLRRARIVGSEAVGVPIHLLARSLPTEYAAAQEVVTLLGGLPLALDQAGAYVEETGCSLSAYLERLKQRPELLARRGDAGGGHPQPVTATLQLSIRCVERESSTAIALLHLCAYLYAEAIPEEFFLASTPSVVPVVPDLYSLDLAIATLRSFSLIQRHAQTQTLSIHRLVQTVLREELSEQEQTRLQQRVIGLLNAIFPEVTPETWTQCERLLPHMLECAAALSDRTEGQELAEVLRKAADYLREHARYEQAEAFYQRTLALSEQKRGGNHPQLVPALTGLALIYRDQGKYQESETLFHRALRIREQALGSQHTEVAFLLNRLANLYFKQERFKQAEPLYEQSLHILEQALGPVHPEVAYALHGLADLSSGQGQYERAKTIYEHALRIQEQTLGPAHPEVARLLDDLAMVYVRLGQYEQAEPFSQRALQVWKQALGSEYLEMVHPLHTLALISAQQGQYEQAQRLHEQTLRILEPIFGSDHPHLAHPLDGLATLAFARRQYRQAELLYQRTLRMREQALGLEHPAVAISLQGLADLSREQEQDAQAQTLYQRALSIREQHLDPHHPETARSLAGLARLYEKQGQQEQAESLWHRAGTIFAQSLGRAHPETTEALHAFDRIRQRRRTVVALTERQQESMQSAPGLSAPSSSSWSLSSENAGVTSGQEMDPLKDFLTACCELHPLAWCRISELWHTYEHWTATEQGRVPLPRRVFAEGLQARGCRVDRTSTARIWRGIRLVSKSQ